MGRGQVGAEVGALTQPAETMGRGLTQRVGTRQQREKKKKTYKPGRGQRGCAEKRSARGEWHLEKSVSKEKKRMQMKKKLTAGRGADVGSGAQTK